MSQILQLDALVMAMACLSTTQTDLGGGLMVPPSLENASSISCPAPTVSGLSTRIQTLNKEIASVKEQIGSLQEQLADLRRTGGPPVVALSSPALGSRFLDVQPQLLGPGIGSAASGTPENCLKQQHGVVRIRPRPNSEPFFVFCEQKVRDGGWTVLVNRNNGNEAFNRTWADYKIGFGPLNGEFIIGLDKIHEITSSDNYELLVYLQNRKQEPRYALYDHFSIGSEAEQYRLNVLGEYVGDAADGLRQHTGKKFSTHDRDNDESEENCAAVQSGAFWYASSCNLSNPFGVYQRTLERDLDGYKGILWRGFLDGPKGSLKIVRMMVRPRGAS